MLSRRQFLTLSGGATATGIAAWAGLLRDRTSSSPALPPASGAASSRVLVVVQLTGGNDALDTVVPLDGRYHDLRPTLAQQDDALVALDGVTDLALHPSLDRFGPLWADRRLAVVPGVGFASDSRSHFDSLASWWTASPEHQDTTGWLGRWLDATHVADDNPLAAIALGGAAVPALRATAASATVINDISTFRLSTPRGIDGASLAAAFEASASPISTDPLLATAQASITSTLRAVDLLTNAKAPSSASEAETSITQGLATAAALIDMNLGTRIYVVSGTGFDTHANESGTHADLLTDLAEGVSSFFTHLDSSGRAGDVLLLTTSEFGRRAQQNGSGGTDHGLGGVHFLVGPGVRSGVHGSVDLGRLVEGDLAVDVDTRDMYAACLDWLGGPSDELLDGHRDSLGLVTA
jgi:uncharacterized protein (DUF1501 family)